MAKIIRATQKQFASAAPTSDVGQFGSLAALSPVTSKNPATIQGLGAFLSGWAAAVNTIGSQPNVQALEDVNALDFLTFYQLAYIFQAGIPEWDAGTTYYLYSYCQVNGTIYRSLIDNNFNLSPPTNPLSWINVQSATPLGYIYGLVPSNDTIDPTDGIAFTAGVAKDDSGQYTMNPAGMTKKVNSAWAAGNNSGGLDTSTIGSSPVLVYFFSLGKSTDITAGDFLMSKSRTAPTMTLPNASGFDIKRLVGHRYWTGTQFAQFRTFGNGSSKKTSYLDSFTVTTALSAGIFSSLSLATWLDGNIAGNANIIGYIHQSGIAEVDIWIRPTGSTQTAGNNNIFAGGHDDQSGPGNPTAAGVMDIILDTSATFQYQTGGGSTFQISLRGFEEHL